MTTDDKVRDEKLQYNNNREPAKAPALLSSKTDKYVLQVKSYDLLVPSQIIQHTKFTYSPFGKVSEKQTEKQVDALKSLNIPSKIDELKQIDLIIDKLNEIMQLQNNIRSDDLEYTTNRGKGYNFSRYSLPIFFKKYRRGKFVIKRCW